VKAWQEYSNGRAGACNRGGLVTSRGCRWPVMGRRGAPGCTQTPLGCPGCCCCRRFAQNLPRPLESGRLDPLWTRIDLVRARTWATWTRSGQARSIPRWPPAGRSLDAAAALDGHLDADPPLDSVHSMATCRTFVPLSDVDGHRAGDPLLEVDPSMRLPPSMATCTPIPCWKSIPR